MASAAILKVEERLQTLPSISRDRTDEVQPLSMGSAPLAFDVDGNLAWDRIWGSFCDLAMAGGPAQGQTTGTLLQSSGASVKTTQELLRHSSPVMTLGVYAKAVTQEKRDAQAVIASLFGLEAGTENDSASA
jgi:hypothetical protein